MAGKFMRGQHVIISTPGIKDEVAIVLEEEEKYPGIYIVQVMPTEAHDDGLREIAEEHMRWYTWPT